MYKLTKFHLVVVSLILFETSLYAQSSAKFHCPVNGTVRRNLDGAEGSGNDIKALRFYSNDGNIFSCSDGVVTAVDTSRNRFAIFIKWRKYEISYHDLDSSHVQIGDKIKTRDLIGRIDYPELMIIVSKNDKILSAKEIYSLVSCN